MDFSIYYDYCNWKGIEPLSVDWLEYILGFAEARGLRPGEARLGVALWPLFLFFYKKKKGKCASRDGVKRWNKDSLEFSYRPRGAQIS